ncbi:MAG TPA: hypothetical protein VID48_02370 [Solirubrobacteraceae bacterium]|jgi:predicted lipoprotein with Yx(FWY)xxD motif
MKPTYVFLAFVVACTASAVTIASARPTIPTAHSSRTATIKLRHTSLGNILVNSSGHTLYEFTKDHTNKSSCASISGCSEVWPSLKTSGRPRAAGGVKASLLSSINLSTGAKQVTYAGHPLYLYSADSGPGETSYVGEKQFGGTWYAINASGHTVK